jgi:hypothetical protein
VLFSQQQRYVRLVRTGWTQRKHGVDYRKTCSINLRNADRECKCASTYVTPYVYVICNIKTWSAIWNKLEVHTITCTIDRVDYCRSAYHVARTFRRKCKLEKLEEPNRCSPLLSSTAHPMDSFGNMSMLEPRRGQKAYTTS